MNFKRFELAKNIIKDCDEKFGNEAHLQVNYDVAKRIVNEYKEQLSLQSVIYSQWFNSIRYFALSIYYSWIENGNDDYDMGIRMGCRFIQDKAKENGEEIKYEIAKQILYNYCK